MPNDAKFGLVLGVVLVIVVAVVFFRRDAATANPGDRAAAATYNPAARPRAPRNAVGPVAARPAARAEMPAQAAPAGRRHTVEEGETLFQLARRYYGDGDRFVDIYRANRATLDGPDALPAGTVLIIPGAAEDAGDSGEQRADERVAGEQESGDEDDEG